MRIAGGGWKFILVLLIATIVLGFAKWWTFMGMFCLLTLFVLYFFRDPKRIPPNIPGAVVSPADGKVDTIEIVPHPAFPEGKARKVGIFLSIFDVHINRAPSDGNIIETRHKSGRFLNAMNKDSSEANESNLVEFKTPWGPMFVKQIAGLIARRIICDVKKGDAVRRGDKIGLICFGSRTEAFLPLCSEIKVQMGDRVQGGFSVIAQIPAKEKNKP